MRIEEHAVRKSAALADGGKSPLRINRMAATQQFLQDRLLNRKE